MKESGAQTFFRRAEKAVFHGGALQKAACMHKTGLPLDLAQRERPSSTAFEIRGVAVFLRVYGIVAPYARKKGNVGRLSHPSRSDLRRKRMCGKNADAFVKGSPILTVVALFFGNKAAFLELAPCHESYAG